MQSEPEGATAIFAKTEVRDSTPLSLELPAGNYTVTLTLDGYLSWTESLQVVGSQTTLIKAQLVPDYRERGEFIDLEDFSANDARYLAYVSWKTNGQALIYATGSEAGQEATYWTWWRYDILSRQKSQIPPPESRVSADTRQKLNLCPLDESPQVSECSELSTLFESPVSDYIVYSPNITSEGEFDEGELWVAKADGTDLMRIAEFGPSYVHWSSDGRWLVTGRHFPGAAGQETHYLITVDGSFVRTLTELTGHDQFLLNGHFPEFSPTENKLAYIGSDVSESFEESDYKLYVLDIDTLESRHVSNRTGLFQWTADGHGLYVLDSSLNLLGPGEYSGERQANLYYIDLTQELPQEFLVASDIPYSPQSGYGSWHWALSPMLPAIAYIGFHPSEELGILLLTPPAQ